MSANENKIKHLEFIQLIITRMNVNSFLVKGWLVTLVAAIFVLSEKDANHQFLWFPPFVTILFWILDAYFLSNERKYRSLYDDVRVLTEDKINYSMDISNYQSGTHSVICCAVSATLLLFYPFILVASIFAFTYLNK